MILILALLAYVVGVFASVFVKGYANTSPAGDDAFEAFVTSLFWPFDALAAASRAAAGLVYDLGNEVRQLVDSGGAKD